MIKQKPLLCTAIVGAGLLFAACGSTSGNSTQEVPMSTTPSSTASTTTPSSTTTPPPTTPPRSVSEILVGAERREDWVLEPGTWTSTAFSSPLSWTSTEKFHLIQQQVGFTGLRHEESVVLVLEPVQVATPGGWIAVRGLDLEPITELLDLDALSSGSSTSESGTAVEWVDFIMDSSKFGEGWPCEYAPEITCQQALATSNFNVDLPVDTVIRVAVATIDDESFSFITFGDAESPGPFAEHVVELASTAVISTVTPSDETTFIGEIGNRSSTIPSGRYVQPISDAIVTFDLADDVDGWLISFSGFRTVGFSAVDLKATLFVLEFDGLLDPEAPQLPPPDFPDQFLDENPTDVDGVELWLSQMVRILESSDIEVGGQPARSWDVIVDDSVDNSACGQERHFDTEAACVTFMGNELFYSHNSSVPARMIYVPDANIWMQLQVQELDGSVTLEDAIQLAEPLFASMTISGS